MAREGWVISACLAVTLFAACAKQGEQAGPNTSSSPSPSASAAASPANTYQGVGIVKALNPNGPSIEIDHEDIVDLMPAMQMEFPVKEGTLLNGLAVNDRVDFTIDNGAGDMKIIAIKKK